MFDSQFDKKNSHCWEINAAPCDFCPIVSKTEGNLVWIYVIFSVKSKSSRTSIMLGLEIIFNPSIG